MRPVERLQDEGAAPERTTLAWTRTALALIVAALLAARLLGAEIGWFALGVAGALAPLAVAILIGARHRYRRATVALSGEHAPADGMLPTLVAVMVVLLAVIEVAYVVLSAMPG
ncbi:MAG TPA: DUF202 domain-containing protein [Jiangellaceae bacterium]|nr:DUF202 domain-containing protein [Jiangellaceae bacterium]